MRITTCTLAFAIAVAAAPAAASPMQRGQLDPAKLLEQSDLNGDGSISRSEYAESRARMFDRFDRNRDGSIDQADRPKRRLARRSGGGGGERLKQLADALDANSDGKVTRAEFVEGPTPMFDRADADRNGMIDSREMTELRAALSARSTQ